MSFTSYSFYIFFLIVLALYWVVQKQRWQNFILLASSAVFYGWLAPWHTAVLFISIAIDYYLAIAMERWKARSAMFVWVGVVVNIGLLASVKYYHLFNESLFAFVQNIGYSGDVFISRVILPLGVSFYVLKKISYLVEVYRGTLKVNRDFIAFAAYISFFPQVFSGPIDRPNKFLSQLEKPRAWSSSNFYNAWQLILMGLFKKIVIANTVIVFVDQIFLMKEPSKIFLLVGGLGFTLQIIADFSSYTDLSRGFAYLLGLQTSENFNSPYLAYTPSDFWNRWHISFSSWLRDYVFFPARRILMKAKGLPLLISQIIPPLLTMFVSGLWHGTGSTFIVWGLYYGVLIVIYQSLGIRGDWKPVRQPARFLAWLLMFFFIAFGWVIFRAGSISWLWNVLLHAPVYVNSNELIASFVLIVMIAFYASPLFIKYIIDHYWPKRVNMQALYFSLAVITMIVFIKSSSPDFIYFQF